MNNISTHSLTKRLTCIFISLFTIISISTHSLTKRLTIREIIIIHKLIYFNSQPHEEADGHKLSKLVRISISTHSLTKRLTG